MKFGAAVIGIAFTIISSGYFYIAAAPDGLLHVYLLDVGQGDAIFVRTPEGVNMLIDGGPGNSVMKELSDVVPLFDASIDYLVLTHPDRDHVEGLLSVLEKYKVEHVVTAGYFKNDYLSRTFLEKTAKSGAQLILAGANDDIKLDKEVVFDVLFPFTRGLHIAPTVNNYSTMGAIIYKNTEILLTGDAEAPEEAEVLAAGALYPVDILKVAHHGSKTSSTKGFLDAVQPQYAAISLGAYNTYHHPHPTTIRELASRHITILRTDENGRIEFVISAGGIDAITCTKKPCNAL